MRLEFHDQLTPEGKKASPVSRIKSQKNGTPSFGECTEMFFPNHHHTQFPTETLRFYREVHYTIRDLDFALHIKGEEATLTGEF